MARKVADCRRFPSESGCSLTIAGEEREVMEEAREHAVRVHGHERGAELDEGIRSTLEDEPTFYRRMASEGSAPSFAPSGAPGTLSAH